MLSAAREEQPQSAKGGSLSLEWHMNNALPERIAHAMNSLFYQHRRELAYLWRSRLHAGGGKASIGDFRKVLAALNGVKDHPLTEADLDILCGVFDVNGDGFVCFDEFLGSFSIGKLSDEA